MGRGSHQAESDCLKLASQASARRPLNRSGQGRIQPPKILRLVSNTGRDGRARLLLSRKQLLKELLSQVG